MIHTQAMRIESLAGGVAATNRQFIRAAHTLLSTKGKSAAMRKQRHEWLRGGLNQFNRR